MKIKQEYSLQYDDDGTISIVQAMPDGTMKEICPISDTAAMAWEGLERGVPKPDLVAAITAEFDGADAVTVERDLDALIAQLTALGYIEL